MDQSLANVHESILHHMQSDEPKKTSVEKTLLEAYHQVEHPSSLSPSTTETNPAGVISAATSPISSQVLSMPSQLLTISTKSSTRYRDGSIRRRMNIKQSSKDFFVQECHSYLLSNDITADSMISQIDYTNFLIYFCITYGPCDDDYTTKFENLSIPLELEFLWTECDSSLSKEANDKCLDDFMGTASDEEDAEYGFVLTEDSYDEVDSKIEQLCVNIWPHAKDYHGGTAAPTPGPTLEPTPSMIKPSSSDPVREKSLSITDFSDPISIATISAAGVILLFCFALACSRSRRDTRDEKNDDPGAGLRAVPLNDEDDYDTLEGQPVANEDFRILPDTDDEDNEYDEKEAMMNVGDPSDKDDEILGALDISPASGTDSGPKSNNEPEDYESIMKRLDSALDDGDWAAVASIAGDLSVHDDSSSSVHSSSVHSSSVHSSSVHSSSVHSRSVHSGSSSKLDNMSNEQKVESINKLIAEGDWNAVGSTAAAYEEEESDSESEHDVNPEPTSKSLLDFFSGGWKKSESDGAQPNANTSDSEVLSASGLMKDVEGNKETERDEKRDVGEVVVPGASVLSDGSKSSDSSQSSGSHGDEDLELIARVKKNPTDDVDESMEEGDFKELKEHADALMETMNSSKELDDDSAYDPSDSDYDTDESRGKQSVKSNSTTINDERIASLEKLIESDDWQGIVTPAVVNEDGTSTIGSALLKETGKSATTISSDRSSLKKEEQDHVETSSKEDWFSIADESEGIQSSGKE